MKSISTFMLQQMGLPLLAQYRKVNRFSSIDELMQTAKEKKRSCFAILKECEPSCFVLAGQLLDHLSELLHQLHYGREHHKWMLHQINLSSSRLFKCTIYAQLVEQCELPLLYRNIATVLPILEEERVLSLPKLKEALVLSSFYMCQLELRIKEKALLAYVGLAAFLAVLRDCKAHQIEALAVQAIQSWNSPSSDPLQKGQMLELALSRTEMIDEFERLFPLEKMESLALVDEETEEKIKLAMQAEEIQLDEQLTFDEVVLDENNDPTSCIRFDL